MPCKEAATAPAWPSYAEPLLTMTPFCVTPPWKETALVVVIGERTEVHVPAITVKGPAVDRARKLPTCNKPPSTVVPPL